jgi:hypothetical protein
MKFETTIRSSLESYLLLISTFSPTFVPYTNTIMRIDILQIALVALVGFTTAAPVGSSQDTVDKRLLPAWPYPATDRIPIAPPGKRELPDPPYKDLYRSIAKKE